MTIDHPKVWLGSSWKMTKTLAEARTFVEVVASAPVPAGVQPFFLPAHTALASVRDRLPSDSGIIIGAQNAHWAPDGAGTGEVSMRMVHDAGARIVELGHSERRSAFGETDDMVAAKVEAALGGDLIPLVCVGESDAVRADGDAVRFVAAQVERALSQVAPQRVGEVLLAYEPVWAIGVNGRRPELEEIEPVMASVALAAERLGHGAGARAVLYGGSVDAMNAAELLTMKHTAGLFVGRAAWPAEGFVDLVEIAGRHVAQ